MRALRPLFLAALVVLLLLPSTAWAAEVSITDDGLSPATVEVEVGETIVWMNASQAEVTLTSEDPAWSSGPLDAGESFSLTYESEGTFPYSSDDGALNGEVVVSGAPTGNEGGEDGENEDEGLAGEPTLPATGLSATWVVVVAGLLIAGGGLLAFSRAAQRR